MTENHIQGKGISVRSRYRGQTVIEFGKCEALSRVRILRNAKGLWVLGFCDILFQFEVQNFLKLFQMVSEKRKLGLQVDNATVCDRWMMNKQRWTLKLS